MRLCTVARFLAIVLGLNSATSALAHGILIGHNAGGQLAIGGPVDVDHTVFLLPEVNGPLLFGWADNDPGLDHRVVARPGNDFFPLENGASIRLEVLAIDAAFQVIDASFQVLDEPGESTLLGDELFHVHPIWHINSQSPEFDPDQVIWQATFRVLDEGSTGYDPSDPFTLTFTNTAGVVPAVSSMGLVTLSVLLVCMGAALIRVREPAGRSASRSSRLWNPRTVTASSQSVRRSAACI